MLRIKSTFAAGQLKSLNLPLGIDLFCLTSGICCQKSNVTYLNALQLSLMKVFPQSNSLHLYNTCNIWKKYLKPLMRGGSKMSYIAEKTIVSF